ncbi:hypothetical protein GS399_06710 [Pedobacter sp. HMF7647]|uniref:Uncharacterized protein n=1 Tax=Hufsiella arboris TaxID=2695275 RepID=A0A7K1Y995_9SPHI|nr:hypothetical protein [Hufsiella arboris]MXV50659.1 hypothetical protein [Hufsiella arboris]
MKIQSIATIVSMSVQAACDGNNTAAVVIDNLIYIVNYDTGIINSENLSALFKNTA